MDLLLHLVREQEVDIHEIEINRVIDGYLEYMRELENFDIELAAEFVLMAATLMAIKSRSLLPREEVDLEEELDPRDELIQRLIEYRRFKDAAQDLDERRAERARLHSPTPTSIWAKPNRSSTSPTCRPGICSAPGRDCCARPWSTTSCTSPPTTVPCASSSSNSSTSCAAPASISLQGLVKRCVEGPEASKQQTIGTFCALLELMKIGVASRAPGSPWTPTSRSCCAKTSRATVDEVVRASGLDDEGVPGGPGTGDGPRPSFSRRSRRCRPCACETSSVPRASEQNAARMGWTSGALGSIVSTPHVPEENRAEGAENEPEQP